MSKKFTSSITLNDNTTIPRLGFGLYLVPPEQAEQATYSALRAGYRHIDSAEYYENELGAVKAIKKWLDESPQNKREDVYYTTKIAPPSLGYEETKTSLKQRIAIAKPYIGYIDLILLHCPLAPKEKRLGSWKAFQELKETTENANAVKSFGVSNYGVRHLKELLEWDGLKIKPGINQIELSPWLTRRDIVEFDKKHGIATEAFSPIVRGKKLNDPEVVKLAEKYQRTPAQILLNWSLKQGFIPLVKSLSAQRMIENLRATEFELADEDARALTHDNAYVLAVPEWDPTTYEG